MIHKIITALMLAFLFAVASVFLVILQLQSNVTYSLGRTRNALTYTPKGKHRRVK